MHLKADSLRVFSFIFVAHVLLFIVVVVYIGDVRRDHGSSR